MLIERWKCQVEGWKRFDNRRTDQRNDEWRFTQCNIEDPWPHQGSLDAIFALEVIEHMIDTDTFLERCHDNLKNNGKLYLSTPNIACFQNHIRLLLGQYPQMIEYRNGIHHVRMYTVPTLLSRLREHGFRPLICHGVNLLPIRAHNSKSLNGLCANLASPLPSFCSQVFVVAETT